MPTFDDKKGDTIVQPIHLVRFLDIPPVIAGDTDHPQESLYLTDCDENLAWVDENENSVTYYAIGMEIQAAEKSKEEETNQCQISLDNVSQDFTSLAQYYKLNGVKVQIFKGFRDTIGVGEDGAMSLFEGKIRNITVSQTAVIMNISNGYDAMDKVPRRMFCKSDFPYIPSSKDPRQLVIG